MLGKFSVATQKTLEFRFQFREEHWSWQTSGVSLYIRGVTLPEGQG